MRIKKPWIVHPGDVRAAETLAKEVEESIQTAKREKVRRVRIAGKQDDVIEKEILDALEAELEDLAKENASAAYALLVELKKKFPLHQWES